MKNKSWRAVSLLRFLSRHTVYLNHLRRCDNRYLLPLLRDRLAKRDGNKLSVTADGDEFLRAYNSSEMPLRLHEDDLSPSVKSLLHVSKLHLITKENKQSLKRKSA